MLKGKKAQTTILPHIPARACEHPGSFTWELHEMVPHEQWYDVVGGKCVPADLPPEPPPLSRDDVLRQTANEFGLGKRSFKPDELFDSGLLEWTIHYDSLVSRRFREEEVAWFIREYGEIEAIPPADPFCDQLYWEEEQADSLFFWHYENNPVYNKELALELAAGWWIDPYRESEEDPHELSCCDDLVEECHHEAFGHWLSKRTRR